MSFYLEVEKLWNKGYTVGEIVDELKVHKRRIQRVLNDIGIPVLERVRRSNAKRYASPVEDKAICDARANGMSYEQLETQFHISAGQVHRVLTNGGLVHGNKQKPRQRKPKCCACGILHQYCDRVDQIQCQDCTYTKCTHKRKKGMMCNDCQEFLKLKPPDAGNQGASTEGG